LQLGKLELFLQISLDVKNRYESKRPRLQGSSEGYFIAVHVLSLRFTGPRSNTYHAERKAYIQAFQAPDCRLAVNISLAHKRMTSCYWPELKQH